MIQMTNNIFLNGICRPWNIHAPSFLALSLRVLAEVKGGSTLSDWRDKFSQFIPQRQSMQVDKNGIARISVYGTLFNKEAPYFVAGYGGSDYEEILDDLKAANSDNSVKGIFLSIDSPGGHACGNDKVAKAISQAKKPVFAHSDGMCCSAAYAIASGASYISATADATIGSIGTILPLIDVSGLWQAMGIKPDYITNTEGTLKAAGYPPSQSDEERASLQAETQEYFEIFKSHVLKHRKLSNDDMRGQAFVGRSALKKGLVDEICDGKSAYNKLRILTRG